MVSISLSLSKIRKSNTSSNKDLFEESKTSKPSKDGAAFRSEVMKLMYLAKRSRPDILKEVAYLASRVHKPTEEDDGKLFRLNSYLSHTVDEVYYIKVSSMILFAYADASFNIHVDGKGHSGIVLCLGDKGGNFYFKSTKQKIVTRSSTEAEIVALDTILMKILELRQWLEDAGYKQPEPTIIWEDNKSAIILTERGSTDVGSVKYMRNRYFFIKQHIETKDVQIKYMPTEQMIADILTKPLVGSLFQRMVESVMNSPTPDSEKGYVGNKGKLSSQSGLVAVEADGWRIQGKKLRSNKD